MCLIAFHWRPGEELLVAANRDEFHARAAAPAAFWPEAPDVFGGRDLAAGGSWMAVSRRGRFAAVTNVRRMIPPDPRAPSRGALVADFVRGGLSAAEFAGALEDASGRYSGFNLLLHDGAELRYANNHPGFENREVDPGVHVVSNATLDTPWPKAQRLRAAMERGGNDGALFAALADRVPARDAELPDSGVGREMERLLSPPFIVSPTYGTRCSTLLRLRPDGIEFTERRFDPDGRPTGETRQRIGPGAN
ncbi:MAG TPA: NRDE family protein [Candidatus Binatia bacterium]|nr:NRDE family protein [Candidatus Binatia bacterium]